MAVRSAAKAAACGPPASGYGYGPASEADLEDAPEPLVAPLDPGVVEPELVGVNDFDTGVGDLSPELMRGLTSPSLADLEETGVLRLEEDPERLGGRSRLMGRSLPFSRGDRLPLFVGDTGSYGEGNKKCFSMMASKHTYLWHTTNTMQYVTRQIEFCLVLVSWRATYQN